MNLNQFMFIYIFQLIVIEKIPLKTANVNLMVALEEYHRAEVEILER